MSFVWVMQQLFNWWRLPPTCSFLWEDGAEKGRLTDGTSDTSEPSSTHKQSTLLSVLPSADKHGLPPAIPFINLQGLRA